MRDVAELYYRGMPAETLAQVVLRKYFGDKTPSFPIDPFKMIRDFGIVYQFMEFKDLEGIYVLPDNSDDIPIIGINFGRPITRQRYTAAHELCHHIKDRGSSICPISGKKNMIEKYADAFASELLMPTKYLKMAAKRVAVDGKVNRDGILKIAEIFGVSFESAVFSVAYKTTFWDGDKDPKIIRRDNRKYKPEQRKIELGLDLENVNLWEQVVNSYEYFWSISNKYAWYIFKNNFIYHENRLEKLNLDEDVVAEIIADLRYNKSKSQYCGENCEEIIQVAGHSAMYDYIYETTDKLDLYKIQKLNKMLYQYAPFPEAGGVYRQDNNYVIGAEFETVDYHLIVQEIVKLAEPMGELIRNIDSMSYSEVIKQTAIIHHRLTVIHPFGDGNGRCSRALLNWTYRLKGLPPIYIKFPEKDEYYDGLKNVDTKGNYDKLYKVFMRETIRSVMKLNKVSIDENLEE